MPRKVKELGALAVKHLNAPGFHSVGGVSGLTLQVTASGAKSWILRYTAGVRPDGRQWRRDLGLGAYPDVGVGEAREKARAARAKLAEGVDPITEKREVRSALAAARLSEITLHDAARRYIKSRAEGWKAGGKSEAQWTSSLEQYAFPVIGSIRTRDLELAHILKVIQPIWKEKNETANRVRSRLESVIDWATVHGFRTGDNPARWKGHLDNVLAAPGKVKKVKHHAALPVSDMPAFMQALRSRAGISPRALEFCILTAARSAEARGCAWSEIDLDEAVWIVPAVRMKAAKEHRVPLCPKAVELLRNLPRIKGSELVFPPMAGKSSILSENTLNAVLKRMAVDATTHGFRSTFKDWAVEQSGTDLADDLSEIALAHTDKNKVRAAYRRSDLFDKRREMMSQWCSFCSGVS